ncbi:MaoC family dehydratase [Methylobrevis albus]|uniref:MaoC family dehydratase n=1 Tax=Methylobrevis albus TaxID=2793297 RepID=A0A931MYG1_9HYPH|nr:MaoC family dehydratase [Methylobrevis albus]MBH0236681.1 MaoC family dehydratase [Methylobrevis albus]
MQGPRGFDDFAAGEAGVLGSVEITADAVIAFAEEFDPQPFHLDPEAGRASPLGGHAASGWHTTALMMRLMVDGLLGATRSMGSPGVRDLKWPRPVLVGDRLTGRYEVTAVRPSGRRSDRGYVDAAFEMVNQRGERVCAFTATIIVGRG